MTGPGLYPVEAPPAAPPRVGIIVSARRPTDGGAVRWRKGFTYEREGCIEGTGYDPCDHPTVTYPDDDGAIVEWRPYAVRVIDTCRSTFSRGERAARLRRLLAMDEERQIGRELWTGDIKGGDPNRFLADPAHVDILTPSGPVSPLQGLACLEQYAMETNGGQPAMIHATWQVITHWASFGMLRRQGSSVLTMSDNLVVGSPGYTGDGPYSPAGDDDVWAYVTDMVDVRIDNSPEGLVISLPEDDGADPDNIDIESNDVVGLAERLAVASWDGCRHGGVRLGVAVCGIGGS